MVLRQGLEDLSGKSNGSYTRGEIDSPCPGDLPGQAGSVFKTSLAWSFRNKLLSCKVRELFRSEGTSGGLLCISCLKAGPAEVRLLSTMSS